MFYARYFHVSAVRSKYKLPLLFAPASYHYTNVRACVRALVRGHSKSFDLKLSFVVCLASLQSLGSSLRQELEPTEEKCDNIEGSPWLSASGGVYRGEFRGL